MAVLQQVLLVAKTSSAVAYQLTETFEGSQVDSRGTTGYDNLNWTNTSATNNVRYTTSPAPLHGTYSVQAAVSGSFAHALPSPGVNAYSYFLINNTVFTANSLVVDFLNGATVVASIRLRGSTGVGSNYRIECKDSSTVSADSTNNLFAQGSTASVWFEYTAGSGTNAVCSIYVSATATKPGSPTLTMTNGTGTLNADTFRMNAATTTIFDDVVLDSSTPIGSNPA